MVLASTLDASHSICAFSCFRHGTHTMRKYKIACLEPCVHVRFTVCNSLAYVCCYRHPFRLSITARLFMQVFDSRLMALVEVRLLSIPFTTNLRVSFTFRMYYLVMFVSMSLAMPCAHNNVHVLAWHPAIFTHHI
jgi:hypothetical protein